MGIFGFGDQFEIVEGSLVFGIEFDGPDQLIFGVGDLALFIEGLAGSDMGVGLDTPMLVLAGGCEVFGMRHLIGAAFECLVCVAPKRNSHRISGFFGLLSLPRRARVRQAHQGQGHQDHDCQE